MVRFALDVVCPLWIGSNVSHNTMKRISGILAGLVFLPLIPFSALAGAAVHEATVSPSGHYKLASESVCQREPDGGQRDIGSNISLVGRDGAVISKCFHPDREAYPDVPKMSGRENWQTKAYWNSDETKVAVHSGGNTWSRIDFYSIVGGRIAILPRPNWDSMLFKIPGYHGETTRLFEEFSEWAGDDTCKMEVGGTARVDEAQKETYPQFSYIVTIRITADGIQFVQVKKEDG